MRALLDLVFPPHCLGCRSPSASLCRRCEDALEGLESCCPRCACPAVRFGSCAECRRTSFAFDRVRAVAAYRGVARDALMAFKLGGERRGAAALARLMADAAADVAADAVTFVPATRRATAARGFDPAFELARHFARARGTREVRLLTKIRETADQSGLGRASRRENVRNAFVPRSRVPARVLLLDDVMTTGSTADSCAGALLAGGASSVDIAVFARATAPVLTVFV